MKNTVFIPLIKSGLNIVFSAILTLCLVANASGYDNVNAENNVSVIASHANKQVYLAEITHALTVKWPKNRTINLVFHGHSVPSGYFKTPLVDSFNAYPHLLHKALKKRYPHAVINNIVTAIGGEKSDRGLKRFDSDVLSHKPDVLMIDYALNDRKIGLKKAKIAWETMIIKAKEQGIKVLLLTPTADLSARLNDANDPLNLHAEQIRTLALKHEVGLVDSLDAFKGYAKAKGKLNNLMSQVNHPNRKGHDLVVEKLLEWFPAK